MNIAETGDYGIVRFIADDSSKATAVLEKNDIIFSVTQVMAVEIPDKPGGLNSMLSVLADAGIDISYMYSLWCNFKFAFFINVSSICFDL